MDLLPSGIPSLVRGALRTLGSVVSIICLNVCVLGANEGSFAHAASPSFDRRVKPSTAAARLMSVRLEGGKKGTICPYEEVIIRASVREDKYAVNYARWEQRVKLARARSYQRSRTQKKREEEREVAKRRRANRGAVDGRLQNIRAKTPPDKVVEASGKSSHSTVVFGEKPRDVEQATSGRDSPGFFARLLKLFGF